MKFRRKSDPAPAGDDATSVEEEQASGTAEPAAGPFDSADVPDDGEERVDLGSLRLRSLPEKELRLQVDERSGQVQAVLFVDSEGALEVRAFAAPRNGDLWSEVRPKIAAETAQAGGVTAEREGRFGTELLCQRPARTPDGQQAVQPSRVVGVNGDRWMLRATFLGRPAVEPDAVPEWEDALATVVVHRGSEAMPVGEPLPLQLPPEARRVG